MKKLALCILVLSMMLVPTTGFAASPWTEEDTYMDKSISKFEFGIKNLLGGWTELVTVPQAYHSEGNNITKGIGKGLCNAVVYTLGGAIHLGTFLIPVDVPIPDNGVDL